MNVVKITRVFYNAFEKYFLFRPAMEDRILSFTFVRDLLDSLGIPVYITPAEALVVIRDLFSVRIPVGDLLRRPRFWVPYLKW